MEPLTGCEVGMIRGGDRWMLIVMRKYFKKFPEEVSQKLDLDIR